MLSYVGRNYCVIRTIYKMAAVGFEPTPPRRLVPKTSALDRSATLPTTMYYYISQRTHSQCVKLYFKPILLVCHLLIYFLFNTTVNKINVGTYDTCQRCILCTQNIQFREQTRPQVGPCRTNGINISITTVRCQ